MIATDCFLFKHNFLRGQKYISKVLYICLGIMYIFISTKEMFALAPKEIMHECNFLLLLCDGKRARQVLYISIVQSGQEKNEKERAFCVSAACCMCCPERETSKKEKEEGKSWLSLLLVCIIIYHAQVMWVCVSVYLWFIFYSTTAVKLPKYKTAQWIDKNEAGENSLNALIATTRAHIYRAPRALLQSNCENCQSQIRLDWFFCWCYPQNEFRCAITRSLTCKK